jgi:hypothetical protein
MFGYKGYAYHPRPHQEPTENSGKLIAIIKYYPDKEEIKFENIVLKKS